MPKPSRQKLLDQWIAKYRPIPDPQASTEAINGCVFDVKDPKVQEAMEANPKTVWTILDAGTGTLFLTNGRHYVNREGYVITEVPYEGSDTDILELKLPRGTYV